MYFDSSHSAAARSGHGHRPHRMPGLRGAGGAHPKGGSQCHPWKRAGSPRAPRRLPARRAGRVLLGGRDTRGAASSGSAVWGVGGGGKRLHIRDPGHFNPSRRNVQNIFYCTIIGNNNLGLLIVRFHLKRTFLWSDRVNGGFTTPFSGQQ